MISNSFTPQKKIHSGFTLIEFLLYIAISGSVLLLAASFLGTSLEARVKNQSITEVDQQGYLVLETITRTIRNAESVSVPSIGGNGPVLTLVVTPGGDSPTTYSLDAGVVRVVKGAAAPVALTNSIVAVSDLHFENLSYTGTPGIVRVTFTVMRVNFVGRQEYVYEKTFVGSASLRQP